jgi:hypothetical protein
MEVLLWGILRTTGGLRGWLFSLKTKGLHGKMAAWRLFGKFPAISIFLDG